MHSKNKNPDFLKQENRPVQIFTSDYIARCQELSLDEIVDKVSDLQNVFWQKHADKTVNDLKELEIDWLLK